MTKINYKGKIEHVFNKGTKMETKVIYKITESNHFYKDSTPDEVVSILENTLYKKTKKDSKRLKIYYGDKKTGEFWEDRPLLGYIGFTNGQLSIPILLPRIDSHGGESISDNCIIRIEESVGGKCLFDIKGTIDDKELDGVSI